MTTTPNPRYHLLKSDHAPKLGPRSMGGISYVVLADETRQHLYVQITGNDGGGYWSREIVALADIERCLPEKADEVFPAKRLASAFTGRSSNNGGFLAAVLHHEGLLALTDGKDQRAAHVRAGDWSAWSSAMLATTGEPYVPGGQQADPRSQTTSTEGAPETASGVADRPKKFKRKGGKSKAEGVGNAEVSAIMASDLPETEHADLA